MIGYKLNRNGAYGQNGAHGTTGTYGTCGAYGTNGAHGTNGALSFIICSLLFIISLTCPFSVQAQIKIGGNVYGGGNQGNVRGSTKVTVRAGDIGAVEERTDQTKPVDNPKGRVFGGARMADVGGNTFVHIDGENATDYIIVNYVYGGNDIAGTIGTAAAVNEDVPTELTEIKKTAADNDNPRKNAVDKTFNSYVRVSAKVSSPAVYYTSEEAAANGKTVYDVKTPAVPASDAKKIYIGQLFGGGNGAYYYNNSGGTHEIYSSEADFTGHGSPIATSTSDFILPELNKTYLEVVGGSIVYAYGGGNNATVKEKTIIHIDNPSEVVNHILVDATGLEATSGIYTAAYEPDGTIPTGYADLLCTARFKEMGVNTGYSHPSSDEFQIGRFFGGNNMAEMSIRPTWNLLSGKVRNLYSGGNRGNMTSPEGLLVEVPTYSEIIVDYLFGGCRMADVKPTVDGVYTPCMNLPGYNFPNELSARVLVRGGDIHNVYGGNDVTGTVYGGNAVGIYTSISGDVYGGGNGAYPYTDNPSFIGDDVYGDLYYEYGSINDFRPNAEQVSIRLKGTEEKPTVIGGSIFCGGNCATLKSAKENPLMELKIGSYVRADKAFLGNNGEKMIDPAILERYATDNYNSMNLTDPGTFAEYMEGAAMSLRPSVVFDQQPDDQETYIDYTSQIGSFYCGGNVGSMVIPGKHTLKFDRGLVIFEKLVGGCNNANVKAGTYNAAYKGGILGSAEEQDSYMEGGKIKDRLEINLNNVVIQPQRWNDIFTSITSGSLTAGKTYYETDLRTSEFIADGRETPSAENPYYELTTVGKELEWNTVKWDVDENDFIKTGTTETADDLKRRLYGGNVYGGCYNSGHVNGNVIININQDLHQRDVLFAKSDDDETITGERRTGVILDAQGDDVQSVAMSVFGAGYGADTEIWGSTTVNLNNGYAFQIFGGGEEGVVGKTGDEGSKTYNALYTSTVNLKGANAGYSEEEDGLPLAETEYIYGGGCEGDVLGDCFVYLGNGRIYDAFGGSSNADIYGATEVHIGYNGGFPWIRDNIYGGNDFGGTIKGQRNHTTATAPREAFDAEMLWSSTYVKYIQGRVDSIFGGGYGSYDYANPIFKDYAYYRNEDGIPEGKVAGDPRLDDKGNPVFHFPHLDDNSFVHFIPVDNSNNHASFIFGGSEGYPGFAGLNNSMQDEAYVLLDDTKTKDANRFANVDVYGGGAFAGVGTATTMGAGRTAIDLYAGSFHNIYGGCNQEGLVGYTRLNVPAESTAKVNALFGGGKGYDISLFKVAETRELASRYCDNYVTCIDYKGRNAIVEDAIYGGNENCRIACDTYLNIEVPVMQSSGYQATIYGAGHGRKTLSGRTNVFMNNGSNAYKVFGGGRDGNAFNFASMSQWLKNQYAIAYPEATDSELNDSVTAYGDILRTFSTYLASNPIHLPEKVGTYPNSSGVYDGTYTNDILPTLEKPMPTYHQTNVHIMNGGNVSGYAYGGGYGINAVVAGSTYIELKGGNVNRDIYGGGEGGPVFDEFDLKNFTATTNVYVEGGMTRNVYGGGYLGSVGKHHNTVDGELVEAAIQEAATETPAIANVTIGKVDGTSFYNGIPAIQRNAYGGGEGGSVYGTANLTINNGYIGYRYKNTAAGGQTPNYQYVEELDDQTANAIERAGNAFGGGYVVNSYVDVANVKMYGGTVRGSLYGGGEVGPIGRGTIRYKGDYSTGIVNGDARIFKAGKTHVQLFDGHVKRNVFGGGRGHDSWGGDGTMYMDEALKPLLDLQCKGYVFGQTEVDVYGGEVGTDEGVALGYGNVFGGGDIGFVYSAYENESGVLSIGKKNGTRYDGLDNSEGYYYKYENDAFKTEGREYILTEDCKVVVEPWCKANTAVNINGTPYAAGEYVPTSALNYLGSKNSDATWSSLSEEDVNKEGVIIHNAVFAGGNTSPGSTEVYANTTTVFGNATASIHDVYHRDLITVGKGRVGGLYGDGNLTLVDGYRELNITNYGTDYYHITSEITKEQYDVLPKREAAYYEIRYRCVSSCTDDNGKTYARGSTITADEMQAVFRTQSYANLVPILDGSGNPVLDGEGFPTFSTGSGTSPMLDAQGKPNSCYWVENGVCSRYAGRPMNTVQRADFCGVFGSRMVMQGAQDRVPETVDYTNYTINRVREVSLNKKESVRAADQAIPSSDDNYYRNHVHGNYFGIYSVVNFLGALTSDVDFHTAKRVTDNADTDTYGPDYNLAGKIKIETTAEALAYLKEHPIDGVTIKDDDSVWPTTLSGLASLRSVTGVTVTANRLTNQTYYEWKAAHHDERKRNNGNSYNKVALASGVFLELTNENGTGTGLYEKKWGLITGVVELDLINVQPGMGGGYVYAKNVHGVRSSSGKTQSILTELNKNNGTPAVTNKVFTYATADGNKEAWETSGNFIHSTQTIIDDCYDIGNKYLGEEVPGGAVPAHYWFIKGAVYIYDQYISAYTGSPNAYSEIANIPLSITSASHGRLTLLNVQPSRYAYYSSNNEGGTPVVLGADQKIALHDVEYQRNDAINFWEYSTLAQNEKRLFEGETYVVISDCVYYPAGGGSPVNYAAGTVLLPSEYAALKNAASKKDLDETDEDHSTTPYVHHVSKNQDVEFDYVFRRSNNVGHDTGYILTYTVNNPGQWNTWYTPKSGDASDKNQTGGATYEDGPTYRLRDDVEGGKVLGQTDYKIGAIISDDEYYTYVGKPAPDNVEYPGVQSHITASDGKQATFYPAYIVTADNLETTKGSGTSAIAQRLHKGATLSQEDYTDTNWAAMSGSVAEAYVVTSTVQLSKTDFIYRGTYMTKAEKDAYMDANPALATEIDKAVQRAYYCTDAGKYGGNYYEAGMNYRALAAFTSMSESDRNQFTFNYDALDLLIDPEYSRAEGFKYQYDGEGFTTEDEAKTNPATYSLQTPIDYTATYKNEGGSLVIPKPITVKHKDGTTGSNVTTLVDGDELTRVDFEALPNERQYYSAITVSDVGKTYYVVKPATQTVVMGDTPYAAGQVITSDTYNDLSDADKLKVVKLTFSATGNYYYCHTGYTIKQTLYSDENKGKVTAATGVTVTDGDSFTGGTEYSGDVPAGVVIAETSYKDVINMQANFAIHGMAPTETSTLYVPRHSDIFDLSAEKIITAIYKYDYVESDMDGMHITPVTEYHVLNIHLNFKSGVPTVEDISAPDIILPGTTISMPEPYVTPGAYEITGGGWKLFDTKTDAESHINGIEITPVSDPLYLYQNGHYLAYYAKTYLGETYSNYVPVSVANYHDLKKVMEATDHHYYIDHHEIFDRLEVEPKIYINNYSGEKNGLDMFKDLYDLSVLSSPTVNPSTGLITSGTFVGHKPLNSFVAAGDNLQFFLRTDIDHSTKPNPDYDPEDPESPERIATPWTPIASGSDPCFSGTLHGDGHTLSGLDNSLFSKLCGSVYNLGVTGSFTSAGVADEGNGYVESCWVMTTGTPYAGVKAVFGNPSRSGSEGLVQVVNSYYPESNNYAEPTDGEKAHGEPIQVPDDAFYNGEVAYDLNNFYLYKRYNDHVAPGGSPAEYEYYLPDKTDPETGKLIPQTGHYASNPLFCDAGYVEDRFADGDFRYAGGTIPEEADERTHADPDDPTKQYFYPIYPDDYIFFGQRLNYGYSATYPHDNTPTAIARSDGRLSKNPDANRVYRAPAYYRNSNMDVAHFNPHAYLAAKSKDGLKDAHPNMTAIDFAGHYESMPDYGKYWLGSNDAGLFYTPLLDDDGLLSIVNIDETQNLLVYAPAASGDGYVNKATHDVLTSYFEDPAYKDYYDDNDGYRLVADASPVISSIYGHLVQSDLTTTNDHLLVDKQDFNAPIAYDFDGSHRMWYQRIPDDQEYVDRVKGWQGISLPFTAELVTTQNKGEITHFFSGSSSSKNGTGTKIGHEYWLREFNDITEETTTGGTPSVLARATFQYPTSAGSDSKTVTNKFLWDYYYKNVDAHNQLDRNADTYLEYHQYYNSDRTYDHYPLLTAATPYIIGLPGDTYYEFDLSGKFEALNTAAPLTMLPKQTVTFASATAAHIQVSDTETPGNVQRTLAGTGSNDYSFTFHSNYLTQTLKPEVDYALNTQGSQFDQVTTGSSVTVLPFRPYFTASAMAKSGGVKRELPGYILFSGADNDKGLEGPESTLDGSVEIFARGRTIITRSHMKEATTIRIVNVAGVTLSNFVLPAGQTIETPVNVPGIYIVNKKKLSIK